MLSSSKNLNKSHGPHFSFHSISADLKDEIKFGQNHSKYKYTQLTINKKKRIFQTYSSD